MYIRVITIAATVFQENIAAMRAERGSMLPSDLLDVSEACRATAGAPEAGEGSAAGGTAGSRRFGVGLSIRSPSSLATAHPHLMPLP